MFLTLFCLESTVYLLTDLDVNLVRLSVEANQRRGFTEILHCDWLPPKVGQDGCRGRLVDTGRFYLTTDAKRVGNLVRHLLGAPKS